MRRGRLLHFHSLRTRQGGISSILTRFQPRDASCLLQYNLFIKAHFLILVPVVFGETIGHHHP